jgi:capsular polysaccharide export protein
LILNSTIGLSALPSLHGPPVKVLGGAVYDLPGLTSQRTLADFFVDAGGFDAELSRRSSDGSAR